MVHKLTIESPEYFRPFDNPNCWQLDRVCEDVDTILSECGVQAEWMSDDWGAAYSWTNAQGVEHSLGVTCADVETARYEFEYFAFRRRWLFFNRDVRPEDSDFARLVPRLRQLGEVVSL